MEIILLEKVTSLGVLGDRVKVKPGYARNFLIPRGKATEATAANLARFEARRAELVAIASEGVNPDPVAPSWSGAPPRPWPRLGPAPSSWLS